MIALENIIDLRKVTKREREVEISKIPEYFEKLSKTYELRMDNEWQVREEIVEGREKRYLERYIEYLIKGGEEGKVLYINLDRERNRIDVVDGRKRIEIIEGYIGNKIKAFGHYYREFSETDKKEIDNRVKIRIKESEIKTRREIIRYFTELNYSRGNEIQNNLIVLEEIPDRKGKETVIEKGTGREIEYWKYSGDVRESTPIPKEIKEGLIRTGEIIYSKNRWMDKRTQKEIEKGYYLIIGDKIKVVKEEVIKEYYLFKE